MKTSTKVLIGIILVALIGFIGARITGNVVSDSGKYDTFAQCLTDKGVVMYGAYWCSHCNNQKKAFDKSFDFINYVECDPKGNNANPILCQSKGIRGYPTWEFPDLGLIPGEASLNELASRSGCELP